MIWIVLIILSITISLYYFIREKNKGHDFRLVNNVRLYMQLLLLLHIPDDTRSLFVRKTDVGYEVNTSSNLK